MSSSSHQVTSAGLGDKDIDFRMGGSQLHLRSFAMERLESSYFEMGNPEYQMIPLTAVDCVCLALYSFEIRCTSVTEVYAYNSLCVYPHTAEPIPL